MFTDFLYLLRSYGMKTSLNEWNSLMDALEMIEQGKSHEEIVESCRARISRMSTLILLDTVEYLKKGGSGQKRVRI